METTRIWRPTTIAGRAAYETVWPASNSRPKTGDRILVADSQPYNFPFIVTHYTITEMAGSLGMRDGNSQVYCYAEAE